MKKKWIFLGIVLIYFVVFWKIPFYILLLNVRLPEDAIVLERQVTLTDECYWHVVAEVAFVSNQDYDKMREIVWTENRTIIDDSQKFIGDVTWSAMTPATVYESCCASYISVKEMDELAARYPGYHKWYCVSASIMGKELWPFVFYRAAMMIVIFGAISIIPYIKKKYLKDGF